MATLFYKQGMTRRRWSACLFVTTVSFLISLLFFWGRIDSDFFSFLYVGQGVLEGKDMYRDFDDNKGPVLYLFFALLRFLFHDRYDLMLIVSSTLLDASAIIFIYAITKRLWNIQLSSWLFTASVLFFATAWYKSFSMGPLPGGGIYSETLAIPLLLSSIVCVSYKKYVTSGSLFALSILTRLTMAFFIIYLAALIWGRADKNGRLRFCIGFIIPVLIACGWFFSQGTLWNLWDNMILWNIQYGQTIWSQKISSITRLATSAPIIGLSMLVIIFGIIFFLFTSKKIHIRDGVALFISSFLSIFFAGILYIHHLIQLALVFFFSIQQRCTFFSIRFARALLIVGIIFFLPIHYATYVFYGGAPAFFSLRHTHPNIKEIEDKEYLHIITYAPSYYFFYHKRSPDSFFLPAFLEKDLNPIARRNIERHAMLNDSAVRNTAFVAVKRYSHDEQTVKNYLSNFQKPFSLIEKAQYTDGDAKVTIYVSEK